MGEIVLNPLEQLRRSVEIRESLGQIQGAMFPGKLGHDREDGGLYAGQLAGNLGRIGAHRRILTQPPGVSGAPSMRHARPRRTAPGQLTLFVRTYINIF